MKKFEEFERKLGKNKLHRIVLIVVAICLPLFLALSSVFYGHVSLWYDNARDLMSAWNNLSNPTLIGPTSGIPGIFYGPYWIWLLSLGVVISRDPVLVVFLTATLPYFIIFTFIWLRFSRFFGLKTTIACWLLFMLGTGMTYATQLWNPYPAPLLTLIVIYLLITSNYKQFTKKQVILAGLTGFFIGLVINFHISFGIGLLLGVLVYLVWETIISWLNIDKKQLKHFLYTRSAFYSIIGIGFFFAFTPTLLFEVRHGFHQTQVLIETFSKFGDVVTVKGISKQLIPQEFMITLGKVLHVPSAIATIIFLLVSIWVSYLVLTKKLRFNKLDIRISVLLLSLLGSIVFIYMTARNPVWQYHFIGVDILFLIIIGFIVHKLTALRYVLSTWAIIVIGMVLYTHFTTFNYNMVSGLDDQKDVVTAISQDGKQSDYNVLVYTTSIYAYDYSYLFRWLVNKEVPYDPSANQAKDVVYLILPKDEDPKVLDFINYRTPHSQFRTAEKWDFVYNRVYKRVKN